MTSWHQTPTYPRWAWVLARAGVKQRLVKLPFNCGKYDKCRRPPHAPLAVCHISWSSAREIPDWECCLEYVSWDSLAGFLLFEATWGGWKFRLQRNNSLIPPQPRAPTAPRSPKHFFFPFTRVDPLAWNYFIIQICLHVQLAGVCTAPAEAHSEPRRGNFLNVIAWQLDDM